jgi:hypothetical protein
MSEEKKKASFANTAYAAAERALREAHADEFDALLQAEYDKAGVTRKVRRTPEQVEADKAAAKAARQEEKEEKRRRAAFAAAQALVLEFPDAVAAALSQGTGMDEIHLVRPGA